MDHYLLAPLAALAVSRAYWLNEKDTAIADQVLGSDQLGGFRHGGHQPPVQGLGHDPAVGVPRQRPLELPRAGRGRRVTRLGRGLEGVPGSLQRLATAEAPEASLGL